MVWLICSTSFYWQPVWNDGFYALNGSIRRVIYNGTLCGWMCIVVVVVKVVGGTPLWWDKHCQHLPFYQNALTHVCLASLFWVVRTTTTSTTTFDYLLLGAVRVVSLVPFLNNSRQKFPMWNLSRWMWTKLPKLPSIVKLVPCLPFIISKMEKRLMN